MAAQDPVIAIDTNVVVRFLVNDDREQARRARALIDGEEVFVATTVLLETEWVLRSAYQLPRQELFDALRAFLDLPRVFAHDREGAMAALRWAAQGMDFADALHLASAAECDTFASFDRALARTAAELGAPAVLAP
jgi:predicted nucleic-acid-binding protein